MRTKRIIPCLDIKDGLTVKGVNFENLNNVGDPVIMAKEYCRQWQMNWYYWISQQQ